MELSVHAQAEYVPDWNGNQEDNNPIVIEHKEPTMDLCQRLNAKPKLKFQIGTDGSMTGGEADVPVDTDRMVKVMTTGIRNFSIKKTTVDGKEIIVDIKSVEDLFSPKAPASVAGLVAELGTYYQGLLNREVDTKNSE